MSQLTQLRSELEARDQRIYKLEREVKALTAQLSHSQKNTPRPKPAQNVQNTKQPPERDILVAASRLVYQSEKEHWKSELEQENMRLRYEVVRLSSQLNLSYLERAREQYRVRAVGEYFCAETTRIAETGTAYLAESMERFKCSVDALERRLQKPQAMTIAQANGRRMLTKHVLAAYIESKIAELRQLD